MIEFTSWHPLRRPRAWKPLVCSGSWWLCGVLLVALSGLQQPAERALASAQQHTDNKQSLDNEQEAAKRQVLSRDSRHHWQHHSTGAGSSNELLLNRHKLATSDDEPIVMKSVHSAASQLLKHPPGSGLHWPTRSQPPQAPVAANELPVDSTAGGALSQLMMQAPQPSQEFDSAAQRRGQQEMAVGSRWPSTSSNQQQQQQQQSMATSALRAPYTTGSGAPYAQTNPSVIHSWNPQAPHPEPTAASNKHHLISLIRDTSELQREMSSQLDYTSSPSSQQQTTTTQSTWMQSVRDNHHGPLRSRFNMSSSWESRNRFAAASFTSLSLAAGNGRSDGPASDILSADPNSWSRRNSKFTRPLQQNSTTDTVLDSFNSTTTTQPPQTQNADTSGSSSNYSLAAMESREEPETRDNSAPSSQQFEVGSTSSSTNSTVVPLPNGAASNQLATNQTVSYRSSSVPLLISNNHSNKTRPPPPKEKSARNLFSLQDSSSQPRDSSSLETVLNKSPAGTGNTASTTIGNLNRGWPMRLLQKTFNSVIKRLVGQQQATSAASSARKPSILPTRQQAPQTVVPTSFSGSFPAPTVGDASGLNFLSSALSLAAASISHKPLVEHMEAQVLGGERQQQVPAASTIQEIGNTLRQHANKKIIDSFIDLPVSERRDTSADRRIDSSDAPAASVVSDAAPISEAESFSNRTGRSSSEWFTDYVADSEEAPAKQMEEDYVDEGADVSEPASEYRSMPTSYYRSVPDVYEDATDPLEAAESAISEGTDDEGDTQYLLYSPDSDMLSTRNADGSLTAIRRLNIMNNHRRPPQVVDLEDQDAAEDRRISLRRRRKPRPPAAGLKPNGLLSGHVAPISIQTAKAKLPSTTSTTTTSTTTTTTTTTKRPSLSLHATTGGQTSGGGGGMLSPMSSSIQVMDLDPSQTQLAHNKLIVAKLKPKKFKQPTIRRPTEQSMGGGGTTTTTTTRRSGQSSSSSSSSHAMVPQFQQQASPKENVPLNLASTLLGSQAISESHIKDVIDRWTRLSHNSSTRSNHRTNYDSLGARSGANILPRPQTIELQSESWANATGNTRSNYSLLAINNRERINPHLFPMDQQTSPSGHQTRLGGPNSRRPTSQRPRPLITGASTTTGSSTTTTTTTTTTSTTRRPSLGFGANATGADDDALYGQTLRNQHHISRTPNKPLQPTTNRVKLSPEAERLRNQFLSLTGSLLDGRNGSPLNESAQPESSAPVSGHVTLVFGDNQLPGEDAALDANKYLTLGEYGNQAEPTSVPVEHSILVLKDNHNQSAKVAPLQFQAKKYLDELVNGSRIRPSSAIKLSAGHNSASDHFSASIGGVKSSVVTLNTNHSPPTSSNHQQPLEPLMQRRYPGPNLRNNGHPLSYGKPAHKNYHSHNRVLSGAPRSELASGSHSLLDMRASDLLREVFDRDPSYSSNRLASRSQDGDQVDQSVSQGVTERRAETSSPAVNSYEDDATTGYSNGDLGTIHTTSSISLNVADPQNETTEPSTIVSSPSHLPASHNGGMDYVEPSDLSGGDNSMQNHRASLRKHQEAIVAILGAIAAKRNASTHSTTSSEMDLLPPPSTDADPPTDNSLEETRAPSFDDSSPVSVTTAAEEQQQSSTQATDESLYRPAAASVISVETKRLYSDVGETPAPTTSRYPITVETVSGQRQKINKPVTPAMGSSTFFTSTTSSVPYSTNKLTESPSNDANLRQTIKNRIHTSTPIYVPTSTMAPPPDLDDSMEHTADPANDRYPYPPMELDLARPKPIRPVIIRRRPVEPQYLVLDERPQLVASGSGSVHKRRKRPTRRPLPITSNSISLTDLLDEQAMSMDNGTSHLITVAVSSDGKPKRRRPIPIVFERPAIIRKRPNYHRRPQIASVPNSIRITTQQDALESSGRHKEPVSIVLPSHSLMERPAQDIRTRPLTIIDPVTEAPDDLNDPLLTRIPETTILHNNIMVSYRPGRPKPGSLQPQPSHGSTSGPAFDQNNNSSITLTTTSPATVSNSSPGLPLGGDAHSVSITQPTTTSRPLIIVSFGGNSSSSSSSSSALDTTTPMHHQHTTHRPPTSGHPQTSKPAHVGNTLVESGSMSVLAQASQGNHSRPWYPTISSSTINSNQRHNATTNSTTSSDYAGSDSTQPTESMQGSESSSSSSSVSGSYSNHNQQQNQNSNVHLGMPFLGGSLASIVNRPSSNHHNHHHQSNKPTSPWRTKKRPANQADSSGGGYNRPSASSVTQVFTSGGGLSGFLDNLRAFMSRVRSIVIALMVMFLPPIALAASVANAMSS